MKKRTLRHLLKASHFANVLLLILIIIDFSLRASEGMLILLGIYGVFLVWLIVLLLLEQRPPWARVEFDEAPNDRRTITYGRR